MRFLALLTLLVLFADTATYCQWKIVGAKLLGVSPNWSEGGIVVYQNGKVWAGIQGKLWMSSDDGLSWNERTPYNFSAPGIFFDIDFFDANNGIVSLDDGHIVLTSDGGLTWKEISPVSQGHSYGAKFIASAQEIVVSYGNTSIGITRDRGATWTWKNFPGFDECGDLHVRGTEIFAMMNGFKSRSTIVTSADYGATWQTATGRFDDDCKSFALDACDPNTYYVSNEEFYNLTDRVRAIYISNDRGVSWRIVDSKPFEYLAGSVIVTQGSVVYFQTLQNGLMRSTDAGQSWRSIGGPNGLKDSRLIAAKNANVLFAADDQGNIWKTINSGGDSLKAGSLVGSLTLSQTALFVSDTLYSCHAPISQIVKITRSGACPPEVLQYEMRGAHSSSYTSNSISPDSLLVNFQPQSEGLLDASIILTLSDGTHDTISLAG
ncbi:MAG: hypothetical protein Q8919_13585, partial [Bacteroidota bacterium]|nr:hypothetical protein [Bacteroidota bacterium]